jgi:hypothetical protein
MPLDIIVAAAVGAAAASPNVRSKLRQGLVYGLAGALIAYDKVSAVAHGAVEGARQGAAAASESHAAAAAPHDSEAASDNAPAPGAPVPT